MGKAKISTILLPDFSFVMFVISRIAETHPSSQLQQSLLCILSWLKYQAIDNSIYRTQDFQTTSSRYH